MTISDKEKKEFEDAMWGVKQYHHVESRVERLAPAKRVDAKQKSTRLPSTEAIKILPTSPKTTPTPFVSGHDIISFSKPGLQNKKFSRLKQEKISIEATLDLHEHTSDEALIATNHFIEHCQNSGFRAVCIIHGKGLYSTENKPILKNLLNHYLREHQSVLAFHSSKNNTGSIVVLLKSK